MELTNPVAVRLKEIMGEKQTNLCVAADLTRSDDILELANAIGPQICMLKTHVDIIEDFSWPFVQKLRRIADRHQFLLFEDRKFADIGNTVKLQYTSGIYRIVEWADVVNAHAVPGPGIIKGLLEGSEGYDRGLILLAQMSSAGNLASGAYTEDCVVMARQYPDFVIGFIANGGSVSEIRRLRSLANPGHLLFAPGVKLGGGDDTLGQQYTTPAQVVAAGADVIIVGRGITGADDPVAVAEEYRMAGMHGEPQQ